MSKFLLIGSVAAMLYGDCVFAMDDIDPWRSASSSESQDRQDSESTSFNSPRQSRSNSQISLKSEVSAPTRDTKSENMIKDQNRFIKTVFRDSKERIIQSYYHQYHYNSLDNALVGQATPTTIETITRDDLRCWNDIAEIRYANDVSYDKLENPKVILYRNKDNSCYIILRIGDNKHGVFYGVNERNVEIGRQSFAVYEVSEDVGSFTDGVPRRIYVDESGLYFVPIEGNSIKDVIKTYQNEGKFNFKGSVIKVSAIDGTITLDGEIITKENFFDNWIKEEREVEREVSKEKGRTVIEKVKETKTVLSTKQPNEKEVIRNFYPPEGKYNEMLVVQECSNLFNRRWLNIFTENSVWSGSNNKIETWGGRAWLNFFIDKRLVAKNLNIQRCEKLIKDGTFASILCHYNNDKKISDIVVSNGGSTSHQENGYLRKYKDSPHEIIYYNKYKLMDPSFVKNLKQGFAEIEKDYEYVKGSDMWLPFEIVRNL